MNSFSQLGLSAPLLKALADNGFVTPTDIQSRVIPTLLDGYTDCIGLAHTGTGKTAAFGLPLLDKIDVGLPATQALILAPTRELGQQIAEQLAIFSTHQKGLNMLAVYGGAPIQNQLKALKKPQHVIIATPGRLIDLIKRKAVVLEHIQMVVLDEADEMLNMGFKEELDQILSFTPKEKMTWLFSATMPKEIKRIVHQYMTDPFEVKVDAHQSMNANIEHLYALVQHKHKMEALTRFIDVEPDLKGVVFCRTKRDTQHLAEELLKMGYKADALHGDLNQPQRDRVMKRFKDHALQVLVATDVAARGIDVNELTHVFHYSLPDDSAYYTHRSGRTARAGREGQSIAFITQREKHKIEALERQLGVSFAPIEVPHADQIAAVHTERWAQKVLRSSARKVSDPEILQLAEVMFGGLTKEELIAKFLAFELEKFNRVSTHNLNDTTPAKPKRKRKFSDQRGNKPYKSKFKKKRSFNGPPKRKRKKK